MNTYELFNLADLDFDKFIKIKKSVRCNYRIKNCIYKLKSAGFRETFDIPSYRIILNEFGKVISTKEMNSSMDFMYQLITGHVVNINIDSIDELIHILKFKGNIRNFKLRRLLDLNPVIEIPIDGSPSKCFRL